MSRINSTSSASKMKKINSKNNNANEKMKSNQDKFGSAISGLLKTLNKFTTCLNSRTTQNIAYFNHSKVCFILINTYENENQDLGIGPLNDGIHIGLYYHRLHYKVYYLYNPKSDQFINYLEFFLKNATKSLTIFYSGLDSSNGSIHDIKFTNGQLSSSIIKKLISQNYNRKAKVVLITNSFNGGSVFDIHSISHTNNQQSSDIISFWVKKEGNGLKSNDLKKSHGIFIYYFCKIVGDSPDISPRDLAEKINPLIDGFNEYLKYDVANPKLSEAPLLM